MLGGLGPNFKIYPSICFTTDFYLRLERRALTHIPLCYFKCAHVISCKSFFTETL